MSHRQTHWRVQRRVAEELLLAGSRQKLALIALLAGFFLVPGRVGGAPQGNAAPAQTEAKSAAPADPARPPSNETTKPTEQKPIQIKVNEVNVPITVLDRRGIPVIDMEQNEFKIFENGVPQKIMYFYRGEKPPLRIGLVLDTSNSARPQMQFEKESAGEFVYNILQGRSSRNQVFLQTFDSSSSLIQDFTSDPDRLNEKIRMLKAGGGKALYDAIYSACKDKMLSLGPRADTRRVLVVISDGLDAQSEHTLEEAVSMARRAETAIYTIGNVAWGYNNPGNKVLEMLADATGGEPFFPREETPGTDLATGYLSHGQIGDTSQNKGLDAGTGTYSAQRLEAIADSLDAIQRQLTNQYNIGYASTDAKMDGTYRTIKVECVRKGVEVHAKPGYFATSD